MARMIDLRGPVLPFIGQFHLLFFRDAEFEHFNERGTGQHEAEGQQVGALDFPGPHTTLFEGIAIRMRRWHEQRLSWNANRWPICSQEREFFALLVKKTSGILFFGPSFRKPARKASSGFFFIIIFWPFFLLFFGPFLLFFGPFFKTLKKGSLYQCVNNNYRHHIGRVMWFKLFHSGQWKKKKNFK